MKEGGVSDVFPSGEEGAGMLVAKEQWAQRMADRVSAGRDIDREVAVSACRLASLWVDDFQSLMTTEASDSLGGVKGLIERARRTAFARSEDIPRYPGDPPMAGPPALRVIIAATDAFILSFDEGEQPVVAGMLNWQVVQL
ncbi:hypothetical protein HY346_02855 [Candidatus Microgenomates bacterium]|nr:hypothetical protein [Candidatus Microgenomates bacterium]